MEWRQCLNQARFTCKPLQAAEDLRKESESMIFVSQVLYGLCAAQCCIPKKNKFCQLTYIDWISQVCQNSRVLWTRLVSIGITEMMIRWSAQQPDTRGQWLLEGIFPSSFVYKAGFCLFACLSFNKYYLKLDVAIWYGCSGCFCDWCIKKSNCSNWRPSWKEKIPKNPIGENSNDAIRSQKRSYKYETGEGMENDVSADNLSNLWKR